MNARTQWVHMVPHVCNVDVKWTAIDDMGNATELEYGEDSWSKVFWPTECKFQKEIHFNWALHQRCDCLVEHNTYCIEEGKSNGASAAITRLSSRYTCMILQQATWWEKSQTNMSGNSAPLTQATLISQMPPETPVYLPRAEPMGLKSTLHLKVHSIRWSPITNLHPTSAIGHWINQNQPDSPENMMWWPGPYLFHSWPPRWKLPLRDSRLSHANLRGEWDKSGGWHDTAVITKWREDIGRFSGRCPSGQRGRVGRRGNDLSQPIQGCFEGILLWRWAMEWQIRLALWCDVHLLQSTRGWGLINSLCQVPVNATFPPLLVKFFWSS